MIREWELASEFSPPTIAVLVSAAVDGSTLCRRCPLDLVEARPTKHAFSETCINLKVLEIEELTLDYK